MKKRFQKVCSGFKIKAMGLLKKGTRKSRNQKQGEILFRINEEKEFSERKRITVPTFTQKTFH